MLVIVEFWQLRNIVQTFLQEAIDVPQSGDQAVNLPMRVQQLHPQREGQHLFYDRIAQMLVQGLLLLGECPAAAHVFHKTK